MTLLTTKERQTGKCWAQGHGLWTECNVVCVQNHREPNIFYSARPNSVNCFCYLILASLSLILLESHESVQIACAKRIVVDMWDWMAICPAQCTSACSIDFCRISLEGLCTVVWLWWNVLRKLELYINILTLCSPSSGDYLLSCSIDQHWAFSDLRTGHVLTRCLSDPNINQGN